MKTLTALVMLGVALVTPLASPAAEGGRLSIAAAADLKFAMDDIIAAFKNSVPTANITVIYGSSGKLRTQIEQGAPFDLYFSADIVFPEALVAKGLAAGKVTPYAEGHLVLWSASLGQAALTLENLKNPAIRHIAMANPRHAPYGMRAVETLRRADLHRPLHQGFIITRYGAANDLAAQFAAFVGSKSARAIMARYGFLLPGEGPEKSR